MVTPTETTEVYLARALLLEVNYSKHYHVYWGANVYNIFPGLDDPWVDPDTFKQVTVSELEQRKIEMRHFNRLARRPE